MSATAIRLKQAVRDIIVSTPSLSTLTPRTTLSTNTTLGANTLPIVPINDTDGSSKIRNGMRLTFYDDLGERAMTVQSVNTNGDVVTIETSPTVGFTGLAAVHTSGTLIYSNIVATRGPFALPSSIEDGYPLVAITVTEGMFGGGPDDVSQWTWPTYQIHVQTSRMLYRPGSSPGVDPELWNDQQEDATINDIESIATTLLQNQELITDFATGQALQFGRLGGGDKIRVTHGPRNVENTSDWHYIGVAQVVVTSNGTPLG